MAQDAVERRNLFLSSPVYVLYNEITEKMILNDKKEIVSNDLYR